MATKIQSIHFTADKTLLDFVNERMDKLNLYHDHIVDSEVYLRLDKSDSNENKIAEIRLNIPGRELFAKKQCKSFEEATDQVVSALKRQIEKTKKGRHYA